LPNYTDQPLAGCLDAKEITEALNHPILKEEPPPSGELFEEIADEKSPLFSKKTMGIQGGISQASVAQLLELFECGTTYGALIQIPDELEKSLPGITERMVDVSNHGGMFEKAAMQSFYPLVRQALILSKRFLAVAMNPPYMGNRYCNAPLRDFVNTQYSRHKYDLYGCFMQRGLQFASPAGAVAMITIPNWMFLAAFKELRNSLLSRHTLASLVHNGRGVFGSDFGTCSFVIMNSRLSKYSGSYYRLFSKQGSVASVGELRNAFLDSEPITASQDDFLKIPGAPIAYSLSPAFRSLYGERAVENLTFSEGAVKTGNNDKYLRLFWEVSRDSIGTHGNWRLHPKGGEFRKWSGNTEWVVNWSDNARTHYREDKVARTLPESCWDLQGICWTEVSIGIPSFRFLRQEEVANNTSLSLFVHDDRNLLRLLGFFNSIVARHILSAASPTLHYLMGDIQGLPFPNQLDDVADEVTHAVQRCVELASWDWEIRETAFGYERNPVIAERSKCSTVREAVATWHDECDHAREELRQLEQSINAAYLRACHVEHELEPQVADKEIALWQTNLAEEGRCLVSYAIGCMMGRYSLDEPGLVYAHGGNEGFDPPKYKTFPADEDGIVPLTEFHWFEDDAASRFERFITTAWPKDHLEENLEFVAESLGQKLGESPRETIRRYLAADFFKHHLSLYKKRPIYWLFSSGKQRGFQALVYLHRYNEGTLARMRTEYVIPLLGKMTARIDHLTDDIAAASSSQHRKRLEKEKDTVVKQLAEVQEFDEKLRHYADQRISLDLDDGVKVNYGKFGTLLAEVKAVTGQKAEDVM